MLDRLGSHVMLSGWHLWSSLRKKACIPGDSPAYQNAPAFAWGKCTGVGFVVLASERARGHLEATAVSTLWRVGHMNTCHPESMVSMVD